METKIDLLARKKAFLGKEEGSSSSAQKEAYQKWKMALHFAFFHLYRADPKPLSIESLVEACPSPEHLVSLVRLLYRAQKGHSHYTLKKLLEKLSLAVDDSPYTLEDWIKGIYHLQHFLITNKLPWNFIPILEYLECCSKAQDHHFQNDFPGLIQQMLDTYGIAKSG